MHIAAGPSGRPCLALRELKNVRAQSPMIVPWIMVGQSSLGSSQGEARLDRRAINMGVSNDHSTGALPSPPHAPLANRSATTAPPSAGRFPRPGSGEMIYCPMVDSLFHLQQGTPVPPNLYRCNSTPFSKSIRLAGSIEIRLVGIRVS